MGSEDKMLAGKIQIQWTSMALRYHYALLVWWSLHKYKCLWDVGDKNRNLSLQEEASHTYTLRLR